MLLDVSPFCRAILVCWDRAANFLSLVPCPKSNRVTLYARSSLRRIFAFPLAGGAVLLIPAAAAQEEEEDGLWGEAEKRPAQKSNTDRALALPG